MPTLNLPKTEEEILEFWEKEKIFEKTLAKDSPKGDFVFYDGPPFATGTPHYGHIVANLMKDIVPRYWTMRGYHVERKWGWDCHGLPIENIVEKELGIKSKKDIEEKIGVDKFNEACRSKVLMYADEWKKFIPRMGRWVDMENDYKTMDLDYMESIWWVFKQLWDKNLIYEDYKSMHICPRCETTLSQSEVSQGYKDIEDISVTVKFELADEPNTYILAWTTTPWTLAGNAALAVGEKIIYLKIKINDKYYILAKDTAEKILAEKKYEIIEELKGKDLVGKSYKPLFPYFDSPENRKKGFKIFPADFVSTEEGTGVVHIAPAFGEDDMNLGKKHNLPFIQHVTPDGRLIPEVKDFAGELVKPTENPKATDKKIVEWLEKNDKLFSQEEYEHSYPHCWRCDTPLLNYATSSWFIKVTDFKKKMIKLAKKISWVPEHVKKGRFGKWLEGAQDWSISRQRFWGSVLPIWKCEGCGEMRIFGSKKELEEVSGQKVDDLHKHIVDKITFKCEKCGKEAKRIPDVLDCWFESGSMPYAQMHYPFENKEKFEKNFPAEFIAEGVDQTRCWFYYLLVLSTAIMNDIAFKNVIANGIVLAEDGQKMSKRLKNYPEPDIIVDKYGADSMRYYLVTSSVMKAEDLCFSEKGVDEVLKKFALILLNTLSFYKIYEDKNLEPAFNSENILDKWIISKLQSLLKEVAEQMNNYDLVKASRPLQDFVIDLSTWYLRRSRDRFKGDDLEEKKQALQTINYVLIEFSKIIAPFTPFLAEAVYKDIGGKKESVHLEDWPEVNEKLINKQLLEEMARVRKIIEIGLALRAEAGIKVRQPLATLEIKNQKLKIKYNELFDLIKNELNVKEVKIVKEIKEEKGLAIKTEGDLTVALNTEITEELKKEGLIRELTRQINGMRKNANLTIRDRIIIHYQTEGPFLLDIFKEFDEKIKKDTLSDEIKEGKIEIEHQKDLKIDGGIWLGIQKL